MFLVNQDTVQLRDGLINSLNNDEKAVVVCAASLQDSDYFYFQN